MPYNIPDLPLPIELENTIILKKLTQAHRALAELKGVSSIIPNENLLITTLSLLEAKDSSAIENIITTHDELYKSDVVNQYFSSQAAKEVFNYVAALKYGFEQIKKSKLLTNNTILAIQSIIEESGSGFRSLPGTELKNDLTGKTVYTPPQSYEEILTLMQNLEQYTNNDSLCELDPLVKMAIIHHQFESIHPFYDGNGRTGRIINVLYLVKNNLLNTPILYLSRYINQNKNEYYNLLQQVRASSTNWAEWIIFILHGIEATSHQTIALINKIKGLMLQHKNTIRNRLPKIYSHELLNIIFSHPYTKANFLERDLNITRTTASHYLHELTEIGVLNKIKSGREVYFINTQLFALLSGVHNI